MELEDEIGQAQNGTSRLFDNYKHHLVIYTNPSGALPEPCGQRLR